MDLETICRLDGINRVFYATHAEDFLATRAAPWPGWSRLLPHLSDIAAPGDPLRILDVGCGNARFGAWLESRLGRPPRCVGLDRSLSLLSRAAHGTGASRPARVLVDLVASGGKLPCRTAACDAVVALALLHHVPSFELRRALVGELVRVVRPGGVVALSLWQFAEEERFQRRMLPWRDLGAHPSLALGDAEIEPGDYLLAWGERDGGSASVRYCHHTTPDEAARLIAGAPVVPLESYRADGRSEELNLYLVLRRV